MVPQYNCIVYRLIYIIETLRVYGLSVLTLTTFSVNPATIFNSIWLFQIVLLLNEN